MSHHMNNPVAVEVADEDAPFLDKSDESPSIELAPLQVVGERIHYEAVFVTMSVFMGYAILISFQHKLKDQMKITDSDYDRSKLFSLGVSFQYIGNLIFRLAHNFVFVCLLPRHRVYVSMFSMFLSMITIWLGVFLLECDNLSLVFIAYLLGGISIGSFEGNLLSAITPLGHATKVWAIVGMPTGFACILIGGFFATAVGIGPQYVYLAVAIMVIFGITTYAVFIPSYQVKNSMPSFSGFIASLKQWRNWFPKIWKHCFALMFNMFFVSLFTGIMLYFFNGKKVPLTGADNTDVAVDTDWYFVGFNMFTLVGDSLSRKIVYYLPLRNPFIYLIFSAIGAGLCLSKIGLAGPFGIFCVFFANGTVYGTSTKFIDTHVDGQYNLISLSVWLFIGDIGSVCGSNILPYIRHWFCPDPTQFVCRP